MLEWIRTIAEFLYSFHAGFRATVNFFVEHVYPIMFWLFSKSTDDTLNGFFPLSLGALAATIGICMIVRILWNAGRGAGA